MKKISQLLVMFVVITLLLWAVPFFNSAISAPKQAIDALEITKSDGLDQVVAGDGATHTYTIRLTNLGPTRARGVVVSDTWPNAFMRGTVTTTRGSCDTQSSQTNFTCLIPNIQVGRQVTITANYTVPPGTPAGTYTNTAVATADEGSLPVMASDVTSVVNEADVSLVSKSDNPDPVYSGDILTYNLSVTNFGPSDASTVVLTDNLPVGTEYQDSLSSTACDGPPAGPVICYLDEMYSETNRLVEIKVKVTLSTGGMLHNSANVTAATTDPDLSNNVKNQDTTVIVDNIPPEVTWVQPVTNDQYFKVSCRPECKIISFEAGATDDNGVQRVRFYRWDHVIMSYVDIGNDFSAPYTWEFDPTVLPPGINQVFVEAYDLSGQLSDRKRIFLIKWLELFMPFI